ncbi:MAG: hypothetical protein LC794_06005 [Acidobacteria bacterium]|nr:hypothetical protein [Acidobacteriota bacterium]
MRESEFGRVGQNLKGIDVVAVMEWIKALPGMVPQRIQCAWPIRRRKYDSTQK